VVGQITLESLLPDWSVSRCVVSFMADSTPNGQP
jgi:hypothetical protein